MSYRRDRERAGLSVEDAANYIGIAPAELQNIENGEQVPDRFLVLKMATVYHQFHWQKLTERLAAQDRETPDA